MKPPTPWRVSILFAAAIAVLALGSAPAVGQVIRQGTSFLRTATSAGSLDDTGSFVFAFSSADPLGTNPQHVFQLFRWDVATGQPYQVTAFPQGVVSCGAGVTPGVDRSHFCLWPSVSDDGQKIAFVAPGDLTGGNPDGGEELYVIRADGTELVQLTSTPAGGGTVWGFSLSGNGGRVAFESDADYLGTNSARRHQVYVVDADGTALRQLSSITTSGNNYLRPTISDDGTRIVFTYGPAAAFEPQLFGVLYDGTGLRQITSYPELYPYFAQISGDGSMIAFVGYPYELPPSGGCVGGPMIVAVDWDGTNLHSVLATCIGEEEPGDCFYPDPTDDGQLIFCDCSGVEVAPYVSWDGVLRVNKAGTVVQQIADHGCEVARASGTGSRAAFLCATSGTHEMNVANRELFAATGSGTNQVQLSNDPEGDSYEPVIDSGASRIVFLSDANPTGEPGIARPQLYSMAPDGTGLTRLTSLAGWIASPSVSADGGTVAFLHDGDPLGTNPLRIPQVFLMTGQGTGLRQLTSLDSYAEIFSPQLTGDGSAVVLGTYADLLNEGNDVGGAYVLRTDGSEGVRISDLGADYIYPPEPRIDSSGTWVVYQQGYGIYRRRVDAPAGGLIGTTGTYGWLGEPDIAPGGGFVVYVSRANPLGTNPDGNAELFSWEAATGTTRQLTRTTSGVSASPAFSREGAWVYFYSSSPLLGSSVGSGDWIYRTRPTGGTIERRSGLKRPSYPEGVGSRPSVDTDGSIAVFSSREDPTAQNADGSEEVFVIDLSTPARISVSGGPAPTVVSWDVESGPISYDVVRGDVGSLALSDGGTVDLGAVACIENDSSDADTSSSPDTETPLSGHAFFYLYRGFPEPAGGSPSYGTSSGGAERIPTSGDCP